MAKVDFFIAGMQKAGTTALHSYLARHPQLEMSSKKEIHFFDNETVDWEKPDYSRLDRFFPDGRGRLRGEATPIYTFWPQALPRIRIYNPEAKFIVLLRHPAFRAHSHWRMATKRAIETLPFGEAISEEGRRRIETSDAARRWHSYVERGFYAPQLRRALDLFGREAIHFARTDRLWTEPDTTLRAMEEFLGVENVLKQRAEYVVPVHSTDVGELETGPRAFLEALYRTDIHETAVLSGIDLDDWLDHFYREPIHDGLPAS